MRRGKVLLAAGFFALASTAALANPGGEKEEAPSKAASRLAKGFMKLKSYAADCTVQGGTGDPKTLRITGALANESYQAEVHGTISKISGSAEAFRMRTGQAGAVRDGLIWKAILGSDTGKKVERLFARPESVLAEVERSKKSARWIAPEGGSRPSPGPQPKAPAKIDDEEAAKGGDDGTRERAGEDEASEKAPEGVVPSSHHLRVQGEQSIAVEVFNRVANSGCMGGG
jgi:hypothetical protein